MVPKFYGKIERGKFIPELKTHWLNWVNSFNGFDVEVTLQKKKKTRSKNQNAYMHGVVFKLISECTGYTIDESKEMLKILFLKKYHANFPITVKSTADLSTVEMEEFLTKCRQWAAVELGCYIPLPNECNY